MLLRGLKNRKAGLDRPLKVGGGIQPLLVTVLTPATTFTVGEDFSQNSRRVNTSLTDICYFYLGKTPRNSAYVKCCAGILLRRVDIARLEKIFARKKISRARLIFFSETV